MDLVIIEKGNENLYVYESDKLLFYSIIKFNFIKRNVIKIFNGNDEQILEIQTARYFLQTPFTIINQDKSATQNISKIEHNEIHFDQTKIIRKKKDNIFALNRNASYFFEEIKLAEIKQSMWTEKMYINVDNKNIEFLNIIILHILATRTEHSVE